MIPDSGGSDDEVQHDDESVEGPHPQHQAETPGGKLRNPSQKLAVGKYQHAPAEMSEADPSTTTNRRGAETPDAKSSPRNGERGLIRRHLRRSPPRVLRGLPEVRLKGVARPPAPTLDEGDTKACV